MTLLRIDDEMIVRALSFRHCTAQPAVILSCAPSTETRPVVQLLRNLNAPAP